MNEYVHKLKPFIDAHKRAVISISIALAFLALSAVADIVFPPDMSRYRALSPEVVDRHGMLLRPFLSKDGYWRLKTTVHDVDPRYLKLLEAYEDKRFTSHWGVDPFAMVRAVMQLGSAGRIVSGGSTLTMQAARLLEPGRAASAPSSSRWCARSSWKSAIRRTRFFRSI